jgi:uncharacterized protein (DUF1697 family)
MTNLAVFGGENMQQYIALLRGINVGGKNKISMPELKAGFEELGFQDTITYLNSGNVLFSTDSQRTTEISEKVSQMIWNKFSLEIAVLILPVEEVRDILANAPDWWGSDDKDVYDNLIFLLPPATMEDVLKLLGEPQAEHEKIYVNKKAIFWSFIRENRTKTKWWKQTASAKVKDQLTIRTANTIRKMVVLADK